MTKFGPFTGQTAAIQSVRNGDHPLVVQFDRFKFYSFSDLEARTEFLDSNSDHELIERVHGSIPYRPAIDFDGLEIHDLGDINRVSWAFTTIALEIGVPTELAIPTVVSQCRAGKHSAHIIAEGWQVANGPSGRDFIEKVRSISPAELRAYIDLQVSTKSLTSTFGLRLPGVPKLKDGEYIIGSELGPVTSVAPWCLQGVDLPVYGPTIVPTPIPPQDVDLGEFMEYIAVNFPQYSRDDTPSQGSLLSYTRITPGYCSSCKREHKHAGAYVRVSKGTLWLNCRREGTKGLASHMFEPESMPDPDRHEMIIDADQTTTTRYNSAAFEAHTNEILRGCDTYIRAPWKTGKTLYAGRVIDGIRLDPNARVLVISCRKTLSTALVNTFGATDYREIKGTFDNAAILEHPVSVWQVESLKRIPSDVDPFDLIVVDEPAALLAHVYQPNANRAARSGITRARVLLQRAVRIYVSDNDLSSAHVAAFKTIRQGKVGKTLVNNHKSWEGTSAEVVHGKTSPIEVRRKLFQFLDSQKSARDLGNPWRAAVVPCHSRKLAVGIADEARKRYGNDLVKLYTSEVGDLEKVQDFQDPAKSWCGIVLVVYTATVSVGVSADLDHISHAFGFFTSNNAGSQQSAQMLFRCRRLKQVTIAYDGLTKFGLPQSLKALFTWATLAMNRYVIPEEFRGDCNAILVDQTQEDPELLAKAVLGTFEGRGWTCDQLERNRSARWFVPRLVRILEAAGCVVTVTNAADLKNKDELLEVAANALNYTSTGQEQRDVVAAEAIPHMVEEEEEDDSRMYTAEEHQGRRVAHALKVYAMGGGLEFDDVTKLELPDRVKWIAKYARPDHIKAYQHLTETTTPKYSMKPDRTGDVQTATSSRAEGSTLVRKTFNTLGLDDCLLTGALGRVGREFLERPSPELLSVITEINTHALRVFGDTLAARRRKGILKGISVKNVVGTLNVALAYVGATLSSEAIAGRRGESYCIHWMWSEEKVGRNWVPTPEPQPEHPHHPEPKPETTNEPIDREALIAELLGK